MRNVFPSESLSFRSGSTVALQSISWGFNIFCPPSQLDSNALAPQLGSAEHFIAYEKAAKMSVEGEADLLQGHRTDTDILIECDFSQ